MKWAFSGRFRGDSRGSLKPPSGDKLFHFHGEFQEMFCETKLTNPPPSSEILDPSLAFTSRFVFDMLLNKLSFCSV